MIAMKALIVMLLVNLGGSVATAGMLGNGLNNNEWETCEPCHAYVNRVTGEKIPFAEVTADSPMDFVPGTGKIGN